MGPLYCTQQLEVRTIFFFVTQSKFLLWWSMPYVWTLYQRPKFISNPHFYKVILQWVRSFTYFMWEFFGFLYFGILLTMHWKWDWVVKQENPAYSYIRYFSAWNLTVNSLFFFFKRFKTKVMLLSLEIFFTLFIWKHVLLIIWQEA